MSCQSSIRRWDSNPQPSLHESPPITTRPGLPPSCNDIYLVDIANIGNGTLDVEKYMFKAFPHCNALVDFFNPFQKIK